MEYKASPEMVLVDVMVERRNKKWLCPWINTERLNLLRSEVNEINIKKTAARAAKRCEEMHTLHQKSQQRRCGSKEKDNEIHLLSSCWNCFS
jgi:hypothetical protein